MGRKIINKTIDSVDIEWNTATGCCSYNETPVVTMWLYSTYKSLMETMHQMVGERRLNLALRKEGRDNITDDWKIIAAHDTIEEGIRCYSKLAALGGWGIKELVSIDYSQQKIIFRIHNSVEGRYQKQMGVCYGSGFMAGKFAGWGEKIFGIPCWSEQTKFLAWEDDYDEFLVFPSNKKIEDELEELLHEDKATRADMAIAIKRLNEEITSRKQAEKDRDRFFNAIKQTDESIVICDVSGNIMYVNPAFEKLTGYSSEEVLGKNPRILQSGQHDRVFYKEMWDVLVQGKTWKGELINKKKDGTLFLEKATISPASDDQGKIINFIAVKHNITEQRSLEEQFVHAQKMETIGRLAGGIAHDYNNMLSVILGTTQMILMRDKLSCETIKSLEQIQKAARRSADITNQLLAFSRKQLINPKVININQVLQEIITMLSRLLGEDITIIFSPSGQVKNIKIDTGQLHQIITNLCINARDALPEGGKLVIETSNVTIAEEFSQNKSKIIPGKFVMLAISDTGIGIDEDILPHVFEPFFTTKEEGKGTGLGLASVYGAVKHNNGFINIYSEIGIGTTIKLYFPASISQHEQEAPTEEKILKTSAVTLLLVEDNSMVRGLTRSMLEAIGHTVLSAAAPEKALQLFTEHHQEIDLLLTDVVMPIMSGKQLHEKILSLQPDIKALFMSGYTESAIEQHGVLNSGVHFIQKPFTLKELSQKIKDVLAQ
jgi:PAS domain S-box-containing protein